MARQKVLIIDEDRFSLTVMEDTLTFGGYKVYKASSGQEAREIIFSQGVMPELILIEIVLPGLSGDRLCKELKRDPRTKHIPVLFISCKEEEEIKKLVEESQADGYLRKATLNSEECIWEIREIVDKRNRRRHPRVSASLRVRFKGVKEFLYEYSENISKGGIFIKTENPLDPHSKIELEIALPNSRKEIRVRGEVVHIVTQEGIGNGYRSSGMGIQFLDFDDGCETVLEGYLEELLHEIEPPHMEDRAEITS